MENRDLTSLLALYNILFSKLNQEGDGIWSRANFLFIWQSGPASLYGFTLLHKQEFAESARLFLLIFSLLGVCLSVWSMVVVRRLWRAHYHWITELKIIEEAFPQKDGWPRPLTDFHKTESYQNRANFNSHGLFFFALISVWILLAVYAVTLSFATPVT